MSMVAFRGWQLQHPGCPDQRAKLSRVLGGSSDPTSGLSLTCSWVTSPVSNSETFPKTLSFLNTQPGPLLKHPWSECHHHPHSPGFLWPPGCHPVFSQPHSSSDSIPSPSPSLYCASSLGGKQCLQPSSLLITSGKSRHALAAGQVLKTGRACEEET